MKRESETIMSNKDKLAVFLCIGQSNITVISTGNQELAVKPQEGTAFWDSLEDSTSLSVTGVKGLFGGFSDTFYKVTGEKCLMIQAALGGTSINNWQTSSDCLGAAINKYNAALEELKKHKDKYEITRTGYLWLQGETDCRLGISPLDYSRKYLYMHETLNRECKKLHKNDKKAFSFAGILAVRSWSGRPNYMRPLNIVFGGPRAAQYAMGNLKTMTVDGILHDTAEIRMITNITENWYSDESVVNWFSSDKIYYEQDRGVVKIVGRSEADTDALMPPDISSASIVPYPDQHYLQKGYNEMGADAAKNLANILTIDTRPEDIHVVLRAFNGIDFYRDGEETVITEDTSTLVPCVTDLGINNYAFTYDFKSDTCPSAYVDQFGHISGLDNGASGIYRVYLNGKEEPVLSAKITMS